MIQFQNFIPTMKQVRQLYHLEQKESNYYYLSDFRQEGKSTVAIIYALNRIVKSSDRLLFFHISPHPGYIADLFRKWGRLFVNAPTKAIFKRRSVFFPHTRSEIRISGGYDLQYPFGVLNMFAGLNVDGIICDEVKSHLIDEIFYSVVQPRTSDDCFLVDVISV
jgi:hypothetical protein